MYINSSIQKDEASSSQTRHLKIFRKVMSCYSWLKFYRQIVIFSRHNKATVLERKLEQTL